MSKSRNSKYFDDFEDEDFKDQKKKRLDEVRKAKKAKKREHDEAFGPTSNTHIQEDDDY